MDKSDLVTALSDKIQNDLQQMKAAALAAHEAATSPENKAENQYDTRGLEASYLAGAQAKRAGELQDVLQFLKTLDLKNYSESDAIAHTALVEVESNGKRSFVFLLAKGGGQLVSFNGKSVQTLTPHSPLGEALMGRRVGDGVEVENAQSTKEYVILAIA